MSQPKRTRLFAIEGPAGAGKSMLVAQLAKGLPAKQCSVVPEFTTSLLGSLLSASSAFGSRQQAWQGGVGGLLAYLGDKVAGIEAAARAGAPVAIADRSHLTQWVLGVLCWPPNADRALAISILERCDAWLRAVVASSSMVVVLHAPLPRLRDRLENRERRCLSSADIEELQRQVVAWDEPYFACGWRVAKVDSDRSPEQVASEVRSLIETESSP